MYNFNENGVCMSPKIVFELDNTDGYVKINVAEDENKKWCFGYSYKYYDSSKQGGQHPCSFILSGTYDSELEATVAAINSILEGRTLFHKIPSIKNKLLNFKNDTLFPQLKLF